MTAPVCLALLALVAATTAIPRAQAQDRDPRDTHAKLTERKRSSDPTGVKG
jgi:hypothetical protein